MPQRLFAAGIGLLVCLGFAQADEFSAPLVKVADGKITFVRGKGKKKKDFTLPADENCRVFAAKYDPKTKKIEAGDEIPGGLKNSLFEMLDKDPVEAWIRTSPDNERIVELRLYKLGPKKKPT
jgi:hypothetical protein